MDPLNAGVEDLLCDESFQRYCLGENRHDILFWETWIIENPDKQAVVVGAKRLFDVLNLGQGNRLEQLASLKDAVDRRSLLKEALLNRTASQPAAPARIASLRSAKLFKYAAAVIILITAGIISYLVYGKRTGEQLMTYEYYTGAHDHKTIMLPDSSIVMLNENSHLSVSRDFDPAHRQVSITGEGYFDIKHDESAPFLVNTVQYTIRVLGTTFNVRSYPGVDSTETTLLTGKIEIIESAERDAKPGVVLKPNQKFILAPVTLSGTQQPAIALSKGAVVKPAMDTVTRRLAETSWTRKKLTINDKSLGEIAAELQAWYGITIRFADEAVKSYRYTATFNDETIFNALRYLQQSYPFFYTIEDDCIVIAKS